MGVMPIEVGESHKVELKVFYSTRYMNVVEVGDLVDG